MREVREAAGDGRHGEGERFGDLSLYVLRYRRVGERKLGDGQRLYTTKEQAKRNGGEGPFVREYDLIRRVCWKQTNAMYFYKPTAYL